MYRLDFSVVIERFPELLVGAAATLGLASAGIVLALAIGVAGAAMRQSRRRAPRLLVRAFVELVRNTPFLVQILFLFFALSFAGVRLSPTATAIIAPGINGGAYSIEIIRGGVEAIHRGQTGAGLALGLSRVDMFRFIVLQPALRAIYPALTSQFILLTLTSSVCASISAYELTPVAQKVESGTFRSFEVYFTITAIYLVMSWMLMTLFARIGRRAFSYPTA